MKNKTVKRVKDIEKMAEAVHDAYLTTCAKLGWEVKAANFVPYSELSEDSKELDRASVRAVLDFLATYSIKALKPRRK